jgi:regulator of cell morphogenesis and NO signaling
MNQAVFPGTQAFAGDASIAYASKITLGEIAAEDMHKALVLKKFGLDFCCGGKRTLAEACAAKNLPVETVEQALEAVVPDAAGNPTLHHREWPAAFLADYIVQVHHRYVRQILPELSAYAGKVARVHGDRHPELLEIRQLVQDISDEMTAHMFKEENILFPYIKILDNKTGAHQAGAPFSTVQAPINMMEMEHESAGGIMARIRELTLDYTLPEGACGSYRLLYSLLEDFEKDLHIHVHLENNILFPKAIELEKVKGEK